MLKTPVLSSFLCSVFLSFLSLCAVEKPSQAEMVAQVKKACAFVQVDQGSGSGFCIDSCGLFVTNHHVINGIPKDSEVKLILDASLPSQKILIAKVVRSSVEDDLALLQVKGASGTLPCIPLGTIDQLGELAELVAFGFPFGSALAEKNTYPAISVNKTNVSALRRNAKGEMDFIQVDSSLNPGNSGGPVVDMSGKIVGIVVAGIRGAGINLAIPVSKLSKLLNEPIVAFAPDLSASNLFDFVDISASVVAITKTGAAGYDVELLFQEEGKPDRVFPMRANGSTYVAKVRPFEPTGDDARISFNAEFSPGSVSGLMPDIPVTIGSKTLKVSQIASLNPIEKTGVSTDGQTLAGAISGLNAVQILLGKSQRIRLDLGQAFQVSFGKPDTPSFTCTVIVKNLGKEVCRKSAFFGGTSSGGGSTAGKPSWASATGKDQYGTWADLTVSGVTQRFRWIKPGTFMMGSPQTEAQRGQDEIEHQVTISKGYWLADSACTQTLWQTVMGGNPSRFSDNPQKPVEQVSWRDCQRFMQVMNRNVTKGKFRLPTESEWEYACRAGTRTPFSFGVTISPEQVNYDGNVPYGNGAIGINRGTTVPVKSLPPNSWGLYEMHGNVWQLCSDWYGPYPTTHVTDPTGPESGSLRVRRGGGWFRPADFSRSAFRVKDDPDTRDGNLGFRLACSN